MFIQLRSRSKFFSRTVAATLVAGLTSVFMTGCLSEPKPPTNNDKECVDEISETHQPIKINGGHHLIFDSKALALLDDSKFIAESVKLYVELEDKSGKYDREVTIGLNGTSASRANGAFGFDDDEKDKPGKKVIHLLGMRLNGGMPLLVVLTQIKLNKGELRFSVLGRSKVVSGYLEVKGYRKKGKDCTKPTPTPTPLPAPKVSILEFSPSVALSNQTSAQAKFSADQDGVSFSCSIDDSAFATCASPAIYSGLTSGEHVFKVKARNSQGTESEVVEKRWSVDATAPVVAIEPVAPLTKETSVTVTFSSNENGQFTCALNNAEPTVCASPLVLSGLGDGVHALEIRVADDVGNMSEPAKVEWRVDLKAPVVNITESIPDSLVTSQLSREFSFAADESSSFECSVDGASFAACTSPHKIENLQEGQHRFEVKATDAAGNVSLVASSIWMVDVTAPVLTVGNVQPAVGKTNADSFEVEFASNELGTFECILDGAEAVACVSPFKGEFAEDGEHKVSVVAIDPAGNKSAAAEFTWLRDSQAPEIRFAEIMPSAASSLHAERVDLNIYSPEDVALKATVNGIDLGVIESPLVLDDLDEKAYEVVVSGVDSFGNALAPISHKFVIDRTAPSVSLASAVDGSQPTRVTTNALTFSSDEAVTFQCDIDGSGFAECVSPYEVAGLIDGEHTFRLKARDAAGNESVIVSKDWIVDTTAPLSNVTATQASSNAFLFSFSADESNVTFVCSVDGGEEVACASPVSHVFSAGQHTFRVRGIDVAGNVESLGAQTSVIARDPIKTTMVNPGVLLTNSRSLTFTFGSNYNDATYLCSVDGGAAQACVSPMTVNGLADGSHTFTVKAMDSFGSIDQVGVSHTWTIDATSPVVAMQTPTTSSTTITVSWTTNELATARVLWGPGSDTSRTTAETGFATTHSIRLSGLSPSMLYSVQVTGVDQAGNVYVGPKVSVRTRF